MQHRREQRERCEIRITVKNCDSAKHGAILKFTRYENSAQHENTRRNPMKIVVLDESVIVKDGLSFDGLRKFGDLRQHRTNAAIRIIQQVPNKNCG